MWGLMLWLPLRQPVMSALHSEDTKATFITGRSCGHSERERQDVTGLRRVDDAVIPETGSGVVGAAFAFVFLQGRGFESRGFFDSEGRLVDAGALVLFDGQQYIDIPPYPIDLLDSTGAGDTYMAGFTFEYLRTGDLQRAGCFASCTSSVMIENTGPDFSMTEAMIRERQEQLLEIADFKVAVACNGSK